MLRSIKRHFHFQVMRSVITFCIKCQGGRLYVDTPIREIKRKLIARLASHMIMHYASNNNNTAIFGVDDMLAVTSVAIIFDYYICLSRAIYSMWSIFAYSIPVTNCKGLIRHPTSSNSNFEIFPSFSPPPRMTTIWLAARLNSEYVDQKDSLTRWSFKGLKMTRRIPFCKCAAFSSFHPLLWN
jgi:hypothetical protein